MYYKQVGEHFICVVLYANDMLLVRNNMEVIKVDKMQLSSKFDIKDLNASILILGMEIKRNRANRNLWSNQRKYVETIHHRFNIHECKPIKISISVGIRLYAKQCPKAQEEEEEDMSRVLYASVV